MLLDTSGLFTYFNKDDPVRPRSITLFDQAPNKFTHSYVLAELIILCQARGASRQHSLHFARTISNHPEVMIVWVDQDLHNRAMDLLEKRLDKGYSLADAVSFVIMRDKGITDALTMDRHFQQEGFRALLIE